MILENIKDFLVDSWQPLLLLTSILILPTILHFALLSQGYQSPSFIKFIAINSWVKGIFGIALGILIGSAIVNRTDRVSWIR